MKQTFIKLSIAALALSASHAFAQAMPYGAPISLEQAKKVVQVASAEMHAKNLTMTIAVVDSGSNLVYLERADQAGIGTIDAAIGKAKAANGIKASTAAIEEQVAKGNLSLLAIPGAFPVSGGVPLVLNGQVIGAIAASGAMPPDDGAVANAGAKSLQP